MSAEDTRGGYPRMKPEAWVYVDGVCRNEPDASHSRKPTAKAHVYKKRRAWHYPLCGCPRARAMRSIYKVTDICKRCERIVNAVAARQRDKDRVPA